MNTRFTEIDASEVQRYFPRFYDQRGRFFEIIHTGSPGTDASGTDPSGTDRPNKQVCIGFVGIRPLGAAGVTGNKDCGDCELEVFVFKQYRNALTKGTVLAVLDLPISLGEPENFKKCWMKTARKTVVKLLNSMGKYGIMHVGLFDKKHVFVREFP